MSEDQAFDENIEEELKTKLLIPYLQALGFSSKELSFESGFAIRLGRQAHRTGRLDILCKRHEDNLFVVEVKKSNDSLTNEDRDQGCSYARLLDQIAPFVVVTNGRETKIYDSITKNELTGTANLGEESAFFKNGYKLANEDEIRIRYEALQHFITLSPDNLRIFCNLQQSDRMKTLKGDEKERGKKYIPSLYVNRSYSEQEFKKLFEAAKFRLTNVVTASSRSIVEGTPE